MKTELSIIIPTYNCETYLEEGLASVLDQMPQEYELIVVDDGSTDGTARKLAAFEGKQENLRVHYAPHAGAAGARNAGLDLARGDYVAFMDCDDCLQNGFLKQSRPLLSQEADLYIFGIERVYLNGDSERWQVRDHAYATVSDFADDYIRTRKLLIYSNCNKFYRKGIIDALGLRFEEGVTFGEDRLFNYGYLMGCRRAPGRGAGIITSPMTMLRYLQRSEISMSQRPVTGYRQQMLRLHEAKMRCFLQLSTGTTEQEKKEFEEYDLSKELRIAMERAMEE